MGFPDPGLLASVAGGGADAFVAGDWISAATPARITDFDHTLDTIVVALSEAIAGAEVGVDSTLTATFVAIDGVRVAEVAGSFDPVDGLDGNIPVVIYTPV